MKKFFQGTIAATVMMWVYAVAFMVVAGLTAHGPYPGRAALVAQMALAVIIGWWVEADALKRGRRLCYDYGLFVYLLWPVVVPVYLFQTRGVRAFITLLWFGGMWVVAAVAGVIVAMVRGF